MTETLALFTPGSLMGLAGATDLPGTSWFLLAAMLLAYVVGLLWHAFTAEEKE